MLDSIYVGMTGLLGYSRGLRVIANNTANINTPGFKGSALQFSDLFYSSNNLSGGTGEGTYGSLGHGLNAGNTVLSFVQGEIRKTGNPLDLAVDGQGLFILQDDKGHISYSRAGQFKFNNDGVLVDQTDGAKVMGRDANGELIPISLNGLSTNPGKATATVAFKGNLSSSLTEQLVGGVKLLDALGASRTLDMKMTNTDAATPGSWKVELLDGATVVATSQIIFSGGKPTAETSRLSVSYTLPGKPSASLMLDFSADVTSFAAGNLSTLAMSSQDGYAPGGLSKVFFDPSGTLMLSYSNGQTTKGAQLALGRFSSADAVRTAGGNRFEAIDPSQWSNGVADSDGFGKISAGAVEISNVDLSQEFSDLVVMQRGFQASSQVVSTANEMLEQLFSMKSR